MNFLQVTTHTHSEEKRVTQTVRPAVRQQRDMETKHCHTRRGLSLCTEVTNITLPQTETVCIHSPVQDKINIKRSITGRIVTITWR